MKWNVRNVWERLTRLERCQRSQRSQRLPRLPSSNFGRRSRQTFLVNLNRKIFPFMSFFGIVLKLFGHFSNEPLAPMLLLIYRSFSILPEILPFDPLFFCNIRSISYFSFVE